MYMLIIDLKTFSTFSNNQKKIKTINLSFIVCVIILSIVAGKEIIILLVLVLQLHSIEKHSRPKINSSKLNQPMILIVKC